MVRVVATLLSLAVLAGGAGASWSQVLVNEIMADPATDWSGDSTYSYKDDEWVELFNAGPAPVDLSSYWVGDADSTLLFNFSGVLGAGRHRVVFGAEVIEWQRANGISAVGLRLNNSGDTVMLWMIPPDSTAWVSPASGEDRGAPPRGNAVHSGPGAAPSLGRSDPPGRAGPAIPGLVFVSDLTAPPSRAEAVLVDSYTYLNHEAENDRSSGRMPDGAGAWVLFDGLNTYTGGQEPQGNGCMPSPGGQNGCPTPTEKHSWGAIKLLYR